MQILPNRHFNIKVDSCITDQNLKSPLGPCITGSTILLSDPKAHCVFQVDIELKSVSFFIGEVGNEGRKDGPVDIARLSSPTGLTSRGDTVYIEEYPREF